METSSWKILAFGDSLTNGYYNWGTKHHPYSKTLGELLEKDGKKVMIETDGISGDTTDHMLWRLPRRLKDGNFDVVIILGGTNDLGSLDAQAITANIKKMHEIVHKEGGKSLLLTIPHAITLPQYLKDRKIAANKELREIAEELPDCYLVDLDVAELNPDSMDKTQQKEIWNDNLHFNPKGYDLFATLIHKVLVSIPS